MTSDLSFTIISERKVTLLRMEVIMANDTKDRILEVALEMFSQNGYAGTNIRELSASLGLVKSGVYKHYESKEAIWNALLDQMIAYYADHFGSAEHLPPVPDSLEGLVTMTMHMVNITVHDEKIIMTRKVLTLEQYRDVRARELATKHDKALPDRAYRNVHPCIHRHDGQRPAPEGRSEDASFCLYRTDFGAHPPVRP